MNITNFDNIVPTLFSEEFMGEFVNIFHDIAGEVYAVSDNQLLIKVSIYLYIYLSTY